MSHTINMLAKRNIQKYKKHYLIVLIVLLIVSTFIFSSFFIVDNLYQMKKNYHISTYGSWYTRIENIDEQTQKGIEIYSKDYFKDIIKYGYGYCGYLGMVIIVFPALIAGHIHCVE